MKLASKVAVVTGGARGIGRATATRLAAEGAAVLVLDVLDDEGEAAAAQIRATGARAIYQRCDVSSDLAWQRIKELLNRRFGGVDVLHLNAFTQAPGPLHRVPRAEWDRILSVNLTGTYLAVQALMPSLVERRGAVVITSSVHALVGIEGNGAYAATKGALAALMRQLAAEYGPEVRVNAVLPGPITTSAWDGIDKADRARASAATVLGRMGEPEEVAAAVAFLAGPDASYVTGASLVVDGGWSITKESP